MGNIASNYSVKSFLNYEKMKKEGISNSQRKENLQKWRSPKKQVIQDEIEIENERLHGNLIKILNKKNSKVWVASRSM